MEQDSDMDSHDDPSAAETDVETDIYVEEAVYANSEPESYVDQNDNEPGDMEEIDDLTNDEVQDSEEDIYEEYDTAPFIDIPDNCADNMGQKVDDILENIKNTG